MMVLRSSHVCRWNSSSVDARTARSMSVRLNGGGSSTPPWDATMFSGQERKNGVLWEGSMHEVKSGPGFGRPGGLGCWMGKEARGLLNSVPAKCSKRSTPRTAYSVSAYPAPIRKFLKFFSSSISETINQLGSLRGLRDTSAQAVTEVDMP